MEWGRALGSVVPALAEQLFAQRPGHVYREAVAVLERALLAHALALTGGNQLRAARLLGLNRNTVRKRCRELGLLAPARSFPPGAPPAPPAREGGVLTAESPGDRLPAK